MGRLEARKALVTGAARGIGLAIAKAFLREGAVVGMADREAGSLSGVVAGLGPNAVAMVLDVSRSVAVGEAIDGFAARAGGLDILVNNAGITRDASIEEMTDREWDEVLTVNLYGPFYACRAALRHLLKSDHGRIISLASIVGEYGEPGQANYAAAKGGIMALTRTLAKEVGSRKITVNAIAPGLITTPLTDMMPQAVRDMIAGVTPVGRPGTAEEVAALAVYLASDDAAFMTGQVLDLNGGLRMR